MADTGRTPARRVDLGKRPAVHLVIVDDSHRHTNGAEHRRADRLPRRDVVYVERQADHPLERHLQRDELEGSCRDAGEHLGLLAITAVSHAHAAFLARREYQRFNAAVRMGEVIDMHHQRSDSGWIAVRIADGGSDGQLYGGYEAARAAQPHPDRCTYFPVSPLTSWTPRMCEEHLKFMTHLRHGCKAHGTPACRH
ncbi:hypothetical protein [Streptomyces tsukubensis]|uniref:hypothetical protein n=1 Tax=Streptomyces tsukubensis TaxID=83656 RepID=UPI00345080DA